MRIKISADLVRLGICTIYTGWKLTLKLLGFGE